MKEKLEPCPFCGSSNVAVHERTDNPGSYWGRKITYVMCDDCAASVEFQPDKYHISVPREELIMKWNNRSDVDLTTKLHEME